MCLIVRPGTPARNLGKEGKMIFVIKHTHDYSTCMAHDPKGQKAMAGIAERAADHGITIKARYANRLEHTNFFIVEATSMEAIDALFDPVLEMGQWDITPVIEK